MQATLLLLCLALGQATAPMQSAPQASQSVPPKAEASQAERDKLQAAWKANDAAMAEDYKVWREATQAARAKGLPREEWPASPLAKWFPLNEQLADQGQPDALTWCLQQVSTSGRDLATVLECKSRWYQKLVSEHADSAAMEVAFNYLRGEGGTGSLDAKRTLELLDTLLATTTREAMKARVLFAMPDVIARANDPEAAKKKLELYERLAKDYPNTPEARRARGVLNSERNLSIGSLAPDFTTKDVDGVEFKLSDYRGKVVVLDFWGFW